MRERSPGVWELIVEAGRDPVTGRKRQVSRTFRGSMRDAKVARAELLVEASKGRHTGTKATLDDLFEDWIVELDRKGRSPNTIDGYQKVYDLSPVRRTPGEVLANNTTGSVAAPRAINKWLTASVIDDAAQVVANVFDEAERRVTTGRLSLREASSPTRR